MLDLRWKIVELVNDMIHADPTAMNALFNLQITCHSDMANIKHIVLRQVKTPSGEETAISMIGLMNAMLQHLGQKRIAIKGEPHPEGEGILYPRSCCYYEEAFSEPVNSEDVLETDKE